MEIGGGLPHFLTTPILINLIKHLFAEIEKEFSEGQGGAVDTYLKQKALEAESWVVGSPQ